MTGPDSMATPSLGDAVSSLLTPTSDPRAGDADQDAGTAEQPDSANDPQLDHPLSAAYEDGRLPWVWGNLTRNEIDVLEGILDLWVVAYNDEYVTEASHLIPACWRQHPPVLHDLPVIYWTWWFNHHHPDTQIAGTTSFYETTLPKFRERLGELLGPGAANCRKNRHSDGLSGEFVDYRDAIADRLTNAGGDHEFGTRARTAFPDTRIKHG